MARCNSQRFHSKISCIQCIKQSTAMHLLGQRAPTEEQRLVHSKTVLSKPSTSSWLQQVFRYSLPYNGISGNITHRLPPPSHLTHAHAHAPHTHCAVIHTISHVPRGMSPNVWDSSSGRGHTLLSRSVVRHTCTHGHREGEVAQKVQPSSYGH